MHIFKITAILSAVHILVTLVTRWHTTSSCRAVTQADVSFEKGLQRYVAVCFGKMTSEGIFSVCCKVKIRLRIHS